MAQNETYMSKSSRDRYSATVLSLGMTVAVSPSAHHSLDSPLQILLEVFFVEVLGLVRSLVVNVNVRSLNIGKALKLYLELFRDIMRLS